MTTILDNEEGLKVNLVPKAFMALYRSREILPSAEDTRIWCELLCQVHCNKISGAKKKATANVIY